QPLGQGRSAQRRQRRKMQTMRDGSAEPRAPGIFGVIMDGVAIARERSERQDVRFGDIPRAPLVCLSFDEVFQEELPVLPLHSRPFRGSGNHYGSSQTRMRE